MARWKDTCELSVKPQARIFKAHIKTGVLARICHPNTPLVKWEAETGESLKDRA